MKKDDPFGFDLSVKSDKKKRTRGKRGMSGAFETSTRECEHDGCSEAGQYRAPRSPDHLDEFKWFCKDHVREYNLKWNFFDGTTEDESDAEDPGDTARIEEERRLMYVAVTRAQRSLHLTWSKLRKKGRTLVHPRPSRFLAEMQLQARPATQTTITGAAARGRLGALKGMLNRDGAATTDSETDPTDKAAGRV